MSPKMRPEREVVVERAKVGIGKQSTRFYDAAYARFAVIVFGLSARCGAVDARPFTTL